MANAHTKLQPKKKGYIILALDFVLSIEASFLKLLGVETNPQVSFISVRFAQVIPMHTTNGIL